MNCMGQRLPCCKRPCTHLLQTVGAATGPLVHMEPLWIDVNVAWTCPPHVEATTPMGPCDHLSTAMPENSPHLPAQILLAQLCSTRCTARVPQVPQVSIVAFLSVSNLCMILLRVRAATGHKGAAPPRRSERISRAAAQRFGGGRDPRLWCWPVEIAGGRRGNTLLATHENSW